jgi:hypothetical protein
VAALVVLLGLVVALLAVLVVGLLRSHAEILRELHDIQQRGGVVAARTTPDAITSRSDRADARVVDVAGTDPHGDPVQVGIIGAAHRTLIAFLSSGCLTCRHFWDAFGATTLPAGIRPVIVTRSAAGESPSALAALAPRDVPVVMSDEVWESYDAPVVPYFLLVDGSGRIVGEGAGSTWEQVRAMMLQALDDETMRRSGATGERDARIDDDLGAAGIGPGHPSLYGAPTGADDS